MQLTKSARGAVRSQTRSRIPEMIWKSRHIYLMILPGVLWYLIFAYLPMGGLTLAFRTYKANLGIFGSPWVGLENYRYVFIDPSFVQAVWRTLAINVGRIVFQFPFPILLALAINELRVGRYKKVLQTVYTFPHFLSWVIVASVLINLLSVNGFVNGFIKVFGGEAVSFLGTAKWFQPMLYITEIWKSSGWSAIIYLAVIAGIDTEQYEAADIDGATRLQKLRFVTLPGLAATIAVLFILQVGNMMNMGFDQIFNLSNAAVKQQAEILDMYIYRVTFQSAADFSFSSAVSLFKSVINMILLVLANKVAKWISGNGLFA